MKKYEKREYNGISLVTSIEDKETAYLVKKFLDIGIQIRHADRLPPIDFTLSDKEMIATVEKLMCL